MSSASGTIVGQKTRSNSYSTTSTGYIGVIDSKYYNYCLKFKTPTFVGTSTSLTITLNVSDNSPANSTVPLRWSLCSSDANFSKYQTSNSVTDSYKIVSGTASFPVTSAYKNVSFTVSTTSLNSNTTYYLIIYCKAGATSSNSIVVNKASAHSVTLNYKAQYTLSISAGTGSTISVKRSSTALSNGATINEGEALTITFGASTGYDIATHTVNGTTFTSGSSHTVAGNVSVVSTASVKSFKLTISAGTGSSITVKRTSSPKKGATTGNLSNGAEIYYSDELSVSFTYSTGYEKASQSHNAGTYTVTSNITFSATAKLKTYTITISAGENVSISVKNGTTAVSSGTTVNHGTVLTVSYTYSTGYENDSRSHAAGNHTITGNTTFSATAKKKKFTFTITGDEGVESVTGSGTYEYNSSVTTIAIAKNGYKLVSYEDTKDDGSGTKIWTDCAGLKEHTTRWGITTNRTVVVTTEKVEIGGTVSIKNGSAIDSFQIGIKGPDGFELYSAYIKVDGNFEPLS